MKLTPVCAKPREKKIAAFDVQGDREADFVGGSVVTDSGGRFYTEPDSLVSDMMGLARDNVVVYAYHLTYDAGVLIPFFPSQSRLLFAGSRLFMGELMDGGRRGVVLGDSEGLWGGMSLRRISESVRLQWLPPPPDIIVYRGESIPQHILDMHISTSLPEYSVRNAEIVYTAMCELQHEVNTLGGELKSTLASTALDIFRRRYLDDEYWIPFPYRNSFARRAYHGGRCEPFAMGWWDNVNVYDFRSHYPAQMLGHDYPDPNSTIGPISPGRVELIMDHEGCSDCTVDVPYCKYPPLPYRGKFQTYFPVGVFRGVWCHNELRHAIKHGVRIREVHATMYSEKSIRPFDGFVSDLWARRCEAADRGDPREYIYKLLLNALSGKFGQRPEGAVRQLESMDAYYAHPPVRGTEFIIIRNTAYATVPITPKYMPEYCITIWSAYITAYGRIALHELLLNLPGPALYCDTDSVMCFGELKTGHGLGELSLKCENAIVDIIAPKMYKLVSRRGEVQTRVKGVPPYAHEQYMTYKEVEYLKSLGWIEAVRLRLNPSSWLEIKRNMMFHAPKRKYRRVQGWKDECWISEPLEVHSVPQL